MKKLFTSILAAILVGAMVTGCSSTTPAETSTPAPAEENVSSAVESAATPEATSTDGLFIGFSLPTQSVERWVKDGENMKAECEKLGIQVSIQLANDDAGKQVSQCENLISQGVDILIVAPHDGQAAATIVDMAHEADIPVISYDRLILGADVDFYVSFDSVEVGRLQGRYVTENAAKGNYVILSGDPADNNAKMFKEGAMEFVQPLVDKGDIKIVSEQSVKGWDPANALKIMEDALTANDNDVQGIICPNDGTAGACVEALSVQGLAGQVTISGGDCDLTAVQRIAEGTQSMTVLKDTSLLVTAALDAAISISESKEPAVNSAVDNGKIQVPTIMIAPEVITKDNIQSRLIDTGMLKSEEVFK